MTLYIKDEQGISKTYEDAKIIRQEVFINEQQIPAELEFDNQEDNRVHYVGYQVDNAGESVPATTARIHEQHDNWHIERVATVKDLRGNGFAKQLLTKIIQDAREKDISVVALGAQLHATGFYEELGFVQQGDVFMDAGIEHITMTLHI